MGKMVKTKNKQKTHLTIIDGTQWKVEANSQVPSLHSVPGILQGALSHSILVTNHFKKRDLGFRWLETGSRSLTSR